MAIAFTAAASRAPVGKGLYARDNDFYPNRSPAQYARALGCSFVALLDHDTPDAQLREAKDLGLAVYLYELPGYWQPGRWQRSVGDLGDRAARFGLAGFIADPETQKLWNLHHRELEPFAYALRAASLAGASVGVTSFPAWRGMPTLASIGAPAGVWGSPQLYGVHTPCRTDAVCRQRGVRWERAFGTQLVASVAAARGRGQIRVPTTGRLWGRDPAEQAAYQDAFVGARAAIFWSGSVARGLVQPEIGSPGFEVMRNWRVGSPVPLPAPGPYVATRAPGGTGAGIALVLGGLAAAAVAAAVSVRGA